MIPRSSRSKTRSRCDCGHKIILVDGHWKHIEPHPEHACSCTEPKPSKHIAQFRTEKITPAQCGIAVLGNTMLRREGFPPKES